MAKVICSLENASEKINGVRFTPDRGDMISDEVSDEVAAGFALIPGFRIAGKPVETDPPKVPETPAPPPPAPPAPEPPKQPEPPPPPPEPPVADSAPAKVKAK